MFSIKNVSFMRSMQGNEFEFAIIARIAIIAVAILLVLAKTSFAAQVNLEDGPTTEVSTPDQKVPKLSEIIPLSTELSARLVKLQNAKLDIPDLPTVGKEYEQVEVRLKSASKNLDGLKNSDIADRVREEGLQRELVLEKVRINKLSAPIEEVIDHLDTWGKEWQREQHDWEIWQKTLIKRYSYSQVQVAIKEVNSTIAAALNHISRQLEPLLALQTQAGRLLARIEKHEAELAALQIETNPEPQFDKGPPMFSGEYYSQFERNLWVTVWEKFKFMSLPGKELFLLHSLEFVLLLISIVSILLVIYKKHEALAASENWAFVTERPASTALFTTTLIATIQIQFWTTSSDMVTSSIMVIGSMACLRILTRILKNQWAKQVSCWVMSLYAITIALITLGLPSPVFHLFIFISSVVAFVFSFKLVEKLVGYRGGLSPLWGSRLLSFLFAVIITAEVFGKTGFALSLYVHSIFTMAIIALIILFAYLLKGVIHWIFFSSPLWQIKLLRSDAKKNAHMVFNIAVGLIVIFVLLPAILTIWGVFDNLPDALRGILAPEYEIRGQRITIGLMISAFATLYLSLYVSKIAPKILLDEKIFGRKMDRGVMSSVGHLIRYFIILIGFLLTLSLLGFSMTNLTIMLSALGVGIGFGLQGIVNNFVCGLILLFERPIREGDTVEVGTLWAKVKNIGMRATVIQTFDLSEVIIPNAELINNQITNWTLSNRQARQTIPVGVDYASDISLVMETLLTCAKDHDCVLKSPTPEVLFVNLGESSLNFELRVWIQDSDDRMLIKSQIYHEIVRRFREKEIMIPFPQRDLHLYGDVSTVNQKLGCKP